jgi:radical SAM superfamily enzyme YgiQ (UPF0313 family)
MQALLVSTYELGHQPLGLASPAAWLRREGIDVRCVDLAKDKLSDDAIRAAALIAFHLPMHTATRLAAPVMRKARALNPDGWLCAYGLYAPLNETWLRSLGIRTVLGGEFEEDLTRLALHVKDKAAAPLDSGDLCEARRAAESGSQTRDRLPRLQFLVPDRSGLQPLSRYATLRLSDGSRRVAGYTEASRGCRHLCRHCPVVPIYQGQFRIVQPEVVLEDIDQQVAAGAEHITFGDPDFFNGPTHAMRIVDQLHRRHPRLSYDVTIKVEHLRKHRGLLPRLRDTGCLFVTSAVESLDDRVLALLEKGHSRADFFEVVALCRDASLPLAPTFVPFHPWMTLQDYCALLETLAALDLVNNVAPIQLAIRLLIPSGSRLLDLAEVRELVDGFDPVTLTYRWKHSDPRIDSLQNEVSAVVGRRLMSDRQEVFEAIDALAHSRAGVARPAAAVSQTRAGMPFLDEPWYCCAEPNPEQLTLV